jgi:drug/metabolite transporter (DMT)-like permease
MTDNLRGILAVLCSSTAYVLSDAMAKLLTAELPLSEIIIVRGVIGTAMLIVGVFALRATQPLSVLVQPMMLVRLIATGCATFFILLSLRHLPLAIVTTVLQATPLIVIAGSAWLYRDVVGWRRWAAVCTGFLGVALIVKPGGGAFGDAAWLVLFALLCTTTRDISTRGLPKDIPSIFVAAAGSVVSTVSGLFILPLDNAWIAPSSSAWMLMTASAACMFFATIFITVGLRTGEIAVVAPFRYVPVPLALLLGYWLWGDVPDWIAAIGILLVLGAGIYTLHRERASLRRARPVSAVQADAAQ